MARYPLGRVLEAARLALVDAGASEANARSVAEAIVAAEAEGNRVCGLYYLPVFVAQLRSGRIDGRAAPVAIRELPAAIAVDARGGFAHPAFDLALPITVERARSQGVAAFAAVNSYNALAISYATAALADAGLFALGFSNAPASVAAPGGKAKLFGTNPLSMAAPLPDGGLIVIDQSASAVAKTEIMMRAERGEALEPGWAQDSDGRPTRDAEAALAGAMLPSGGVKGANIALMVELMAAALTGSPLSAEAESLGDADAPHPRLGQFFLAIDPQAFGGAGAAERMAALQRLFAADPALRLPGARRARNRAEAEANGLALTPEQAALLGM